VVAETRELVVEACGVDGDAHRDGANGFFAVPMKWYV
jgi:hypothetical protein